jgi:hypothetical protein
MPPHPFPSPGAEIVTKLRFHNGLSCATEVRLVVRSRTVARSAFPSRFPHFPIPSNATSIGHRHHQDAAACPTSPRAATGAHGSVRRRMLSRNAKFVSPIDVGFSRSFLQRGALHSSPLRSCSIIPRTDVVTQAQSRSFNRDLSCRPICPECSQVPAYQSDNDTLNREIAGGINQDGRDVRVVTPKDHDTPVAMLFDGNAFERRLLV